MCEERVYVERGCGERMCAKIVYVVESVCGREFVWGERVGVRTG